MTRKLVLHLLRLVCVSEVFFVGIPPGESLLRAHDATVVLGKRTIQLFPQARLCWGFAEMRNATQGKVAG